MAVVDSGIMRELIINDIVIALKQYIPYGIVTGIFVIFIICIIKSLLSKETISKTILSNRVKLILIYVLYIYCFIMVSITYLSREPGSRDGVDLKLFSTFSNNIYDNRYPIENLLLFIPFGFLLPLLWYRFYSAVWCIGAGLIFSLAIEVSQYLTKRGYFQTDDIMMNIIGTLIGFCVINWGRKILRLLLNYKKL